MTRAGNQTIRGAHRHEAVQVTLPSRRFCALGQWETAGAESSRKPPKCFVTCSYIRSGPVTARRLRPVAMTLLCGVVSLRPARRPSRFRIAGNARSSASSDRSWGLGSWGRRALPRTTCDLPARSSRMRDAWGSRKSRRHDDARVRSHCARVLNRPACQGVQGRRRGCDAAGGALRSTSWTARSDWTNTPGSRWCATRARRGIQSSCRNWSEQRVRAASTPTASTVRSSVPRYRRAYSCGPPRPLHNVTQLANENLHFLIRGVTNAAQTAFNRPM